MKKRNQFTNSGVVGALCPTCGESYVEDHLENDCPFMNDQLDLTDQCPHWKTSQKSWLDLPCQDCDQAILRRNAGTRLTILGLVDVGGGKLEFREMHRCDHCGKDFVVSFTETSNPEEE